MSAEDKDPIDALVRMLKQQRDELKLKMHLAGKDAQDEWEKLEQRWKEVEEWAEPLTTATKEAADKASEAAKSAAEHAAEAGKQAGHEAKKVTAAAMDVAAREIQSAYEKFRRMLD